MLIPNQSGQTMTDFQLKAAIEAILISAETPVNIMTIAGAVESPLAEVKLAITELVSDYQSGFEGSGRGFELREVGGGWRIYVNPVHDWAVKKLVSNENPAKLSQAALETLAVIAYKQPVSRGQVSQIRGVNVDGVFKTLLSRSLITELEVDTETGASLFGTSSLLLELLGINSLEQLPPISPLLPDQDNFND